MIDLGLRMRYGVVSEVMCGKQCFLGIEEVVQLEELYLYYWGNNVLGMNKVECFLRMRNFYTTYMLTESGL